MPKLRGRLLSRGCVGSGGATLPAVSLYASTELSSGMANGSLSCIDGAMDPSKPSTTLLFTGGIAAPGRYLGDSDRCWWRRPCINPRTRTEDAQSMSRDGGGPNGAER